MLRNMLLTAAALTFAGGALTSTLHADEWDRQTHISINNPITIQGKVLDSGSYTLKLMDSDSDRDVVEVFDGSNQHLITTVQAIPAYREDPTSKSVFTFYEQPAGNPPALDKWFYPGDTYGLQFRPPQQ